MTKREKPKRKAKYKPGVPVPPSPEVVRRRGKREVVVEISEALISQNEGELLPKRAITPATLPRYKYLQPSFADKLKFPNSTRPIKGPPPL